VVTRARAIRHIGPRGTAARILVGGAALGGAILVDLTAFEALLGLVVIPFTIATAVALRGPHAPPIRLLGARGHLLSCGLILAAALILVAFGGLIDAALLFYGTSMLVAAARGYAGCELFAISNWLWRRDDQIACALFAPIDLTEPRPATVELVHLEDCPHWHEAATRLGEAMRSSGLDPAGVRYRSVPTASAPADFPGSPTIVIDGRDPFPTPTPAGPTCRRYRTEHGLDVAPSLGQLAEVLPGPSCTRP
jgi:hypothetical protein